MTRDKQQQFATRSHDKKAIHATAVLQLYLLIGSRYYKIIVGLCFLCFLDRKLALARCFILKTSRLAAPRDPTTQRPQVTSWAA